MSAAEAAFTGNPASTSTSITGYKPTLISRALDTNAVTTGHYEDHSMDAMLENVSGSHLQIKDSFEDNITVNISLDFDGFPYPSRYPWWHIVLASIVVTGIMLVIVVGNALVVIAIAKDRQLKGLQNWFIASLAVSDLFVGLLIMPLSLANELMGYWYFGTVFCELWLSTDVLLCTASILNLCLISLDRYWSITRALSYVRQRTKTRAVVMITLVWLLSMILCFPPLAGWKRPQPSVHGLPLCVLSEEPGYVVYSTVGSFYIPLIVMILVYFKIFLAARERARRNLKKPNTLPPTNGKSSSTTSFSNPSRQIDDHGKLSPTAEINSDDEMSQMDTMMPDTTAVPDTEVTSGMESTTDPEMGYKMTSVTNHGAKLLPSQDEQRKLLSEDTEDSEAHKSLGDKAKQIQFSEETDSDSLCAKPNKTTGFAHSMHDDNMKPLLEEEIQRQTHSHPKGALPNVKVSNDTDDNKHNDHTDGNSNTPLKKFLSPTYSSNRACSNLPPHRGAHPKAKKHHLHHPKDDPDRQKRKIARARERRATIVLGIIMATFIGCWLPFFSIYLVSSLAKLHVPGPVFAVIFWLGYVNSALNPIIYTIFNQDFRKAFKKIIFGRRRGSGF